MTIQQLILTMRENAEYFNNIGLESTGSCFSDTADRLEALLAENEHLREVTKMVGNDTNVPTSTEGVE